MTAPNPVHELIKAMSKSMDGYAYESWRNGWRVVKRGDVPSMEIECANESSASLLCRALNALPAELLWKLSRENIRAFDKNERCA